MKVKKEIKMDLLFLESNSFILEDIKIKLEEKLKNKPLIFFNQLEYFSENDIEKNQRKILEKMIKKNKVVLIYIKLRKFKNEKIDSFYEKEMQKIGIKKIVIIDIQNHLDDDYIASKIIEICGGQKI
jgi:hypothetical protein